MKLSGACEVDRPAAEVFEFVSDASNNPRWQKGQQSCEWTSPTPIGVGSTYEQQARFLGRTVTTSFVVTEYQPGRSITIESTGGSFPITVRRSVDPVDEERTRVTAEIDGDPGRFFRLFGPLVQRLAQRSVDADYARLETLLDSGAAAEREGPG